jgi:PAS domain S-box-containing protein
MPIPAVSRLAARVISKTSVQTVLIIPFALQILGTVGLVAYFSYRDAHKQAHELVAQLQIEANSRIAHHLDSYLATPVQLNKINVDAYKLGLLNFSDFQDSGQYFWKQLHIFHINYINFATPKGEFIGAGDYGEGSIQIEEIPKNTKGKSYKYDTDQQGNRTRLVSVQDFNPHAESWYLKAAKAGKPIWSDIYNWDTNPEILSIAASYPLYDENKKLIGVTGIDLKLSDISSFLKTLKIGKSGKVFIVERSGLLVASSVNYPPFTMVNGKAERINIFHNRIPAFQPITQDLYKSFIYFNKTTNTPQLSVEISGKNQSIQVFPWGDKMGLDWLIIVVVSTSDFKESFERNIYFSSIIIICILILAIVNANLAVRWVTQPILQLNIAAKNIAKLEWDKPIEIERTDEVGELANSFKTMAAHLQQSFAKLQALNTALAQRESQLRQFFDAIPVGVSIHEPSGKVLYFNPIAKHLLGIDTIPDATEEELTQTYQLYHQNQLYPIEELPALRALKGETVFVDNIEVHRNGEIIPCEIRSTPIFDEQGTIIYAIAAFADITQRKQAEQLLANYNQTLETQVADRTAKLALANEQLKQEIAERQRADQEIHELTTALENAVDGISRLDVQGRYMAVNKAYASITGYQPEEMIGMEWQRTVHPEDCQKMSAAYQKMLEVGKVEAQARGVRKDGSIFYKQLVMTTAQDEQNNFIGHYCFMKDITERQQAEESLREKEEQLQLALEGSGDGFWDWNIQTGEVYLSPRYLEMLGYEADELPPELNSWDRLIHPDDKPWAMETLNAHLADSSVPYQFDYRLLTKSGEWKWIANYGKVVTRDENGAPLRMTGTHRDVSDKKLAEIQLQQAVLSAEAANRTKSQFLANMSHELRTPLNGILGYAQILAADKNCTPQQKKGVSIIHQCGTHLLTLINDILDLSKIEAEKIELYREEFHFPSFLTSLSEIFQLKATEKSLTFIYLPRSELPTGIYADQKRLRQVLMNLLSNAVKFTDDGSVTFKVEVIGNGELGMGTERQTTHNQIRFQVEDTGIGISPEQLEKIFLPFEQVGDKSRHAEGTGLGLAITQKILALMGSNIFVESSPGVGSRFWFDLNVPVVSTSMQSILIKTTDTIIGYKPRKTEAALREDDKQWKILIVDDRWENCAVLISILEPIGFEVEQAANGQEGLEKALEFKPDLILADLVMPVMDGYQMARQLRQYLEFQTTIIIAISANAFNVDRQNSLDAGCNDFLPKPIQAEDLLDKIQSYFNLSWIYDSRSKSQSQELGDKLSYNSQTLRTEIVIPPKEELLALYQAANTGYVHGVEQELIRLQQLNSDYSSFITRILELADDFEYEEITNLIDRYLAEEPE